MHNKAAIRILVVLSIFLSLNFFALSLTNCGTTHQQRVNIVSDVMSDFNFVQKTVEEFMIDLNDKNILPTEGIIWQSFKSVNAKLYPISVRLNENWKLVPQTDSAVSNFLLTKDFRDGIDLLIQLMTVANENGLNNTEAKDKLDSLVKASSPSE